MYKAQNLTQKTFRFIFGAFAGVFLSICRQAGQMLGGGRDCAWFHEPFARVLHTKWWWCCRCNCSQDVSQGRRRENCRKLKQSRRHFIEARRHAERRFLGSSSSSPSLSHTLSLSWHILFAICLWVQYKWPLHCFNLVHLLPRGSNLPAW